MMIEFMLYFILALNLMLVLWYVYRKYYFNKKDKEQEEQIEDSFNTDCVGCDSECVDCDPVIPNLSPQKYPHPEISSTLIAELENTTKSLEEVLLKLGYKTMMDIPLETLLKLDNTLSRCSSCGYWSKHGGRSFIFLQKCPLCKKPLV